MHPSAVSMNSPDFIECFYRLILAKYVALLYGYSFAAIQ
jgi:hypothetical protein